MKTMARLSMILIITFSTLVYHVFAKSATQSAPQSGTQSTDTGAKKLVQDFKVKVESFVEHENQKAKYELEQKKFAREQKEIRLKGLREEQKARREYLAVRKKKVYPEETPSYQAFLVRKAKEEEQQKQIQARYSKNHRELKALESEFDQTLGPAEYGLDNVPRPKVKVDEPQSQL